MKVLDESIGAQVLVELRRQRKIRGKLLSYDQHLNLHLEDADEITTDLENGKDTIKEIGNVILRGDNVVVVSPTPQRARE
ncbi:MAG: LSM domain-containing protein [Candidatus Thorarchaeota archaeon]